VEEMKEIERVGGEGMEEVRDEPEDIKIQEDCSVD
jgi:hypothetical protein